MVCLLDSITLARLHCAWDSISIFFGVKAGSYFFTGWCAILALGPETMKFASGCFPVIHQRVSKETSKISKAGDWVCSTSFIRLEESLILSCWSSHTSIVGYLGLTYLCHSNGKASSKFDGIIIESRVVKRTRPFIQKKSLSFVCLFRGGPSKPFLYNSYEWLISLPGPLQTSTYLSSHWIPFLSL